ncbi:hypothetical protein [Clostridium sp.]|uniref:hypothetical protein n=1 Tax=Clostridium sp. TaxID=1506 RepID=UPI003217D515
MNEDLIDKMRQKLISGRLWPLEAQAELSVEILREKLDKILPWAMESSDIDFWIVMGKENNEDPTMKTFFSWDMPNARRVSILTFYYDKKSKKVRKMMLGNHSPIMNLLYENVQNKNENCWEGLKRIIDEINPRSIAIQKSNNYSFCDGLTFTLHKNLMEILSDSQKNKVCSAEKLSVKWLQKVTAKELEVLKILTEITQDIIKTTFSSDSIKINETTTTDLEWMMRNTILMLGLDFWFGPDIDMQRYGNSVSRIFGERINYGDFLHCDVGVFCRFINLHTDMQWVCYVRTQGEKFVPQGLKELLVKGNRLQDIVTSNFKYKKTGNDVFFESVSKAKEEGLKPMIYSHPIGTFGHGSGTSIGRYDIQGVVEGGGECPIENQTCYALELNICDNLSEWNGQEVYMYLEEDIYFDGKVSYILGRQTEIIEI